MDNEKVVIIGDGMVGSTIAYTLMMKSYINEIGIIDVNKDKVMKKLKVEMYCPKTCLPTSAYLAINNANHDMDVAINDMRVINEVTPSYLATLKPIISTHGRNFGWWC